MVVRAIYEEAEASVLCWFATVSSKGVPNVSPKEVFAVLGETSVVVADIASPITVRNLRHNPNACVSFVDVFRQTGYKLTGHAEVIPPEDERFTTLVEPLLAITQGHFKIRNLLYLSVRASTPIIAPSYRLHPDRCMSDRIADAMTTYGVRQRGGD